MRRRSVRAALGGLAAAGIALVVLAEPATADPIRDAQWHLATLRIAAAQKISQGDGVTVAVIDSGVDAGHPDLSGSILPGQDFTTAEGGNGEEDIDGHGTLMAGLIAAHGRALGIAPHAKILTIRTKVLGQSQLGGKLPDAIDWARTHGASVICIAQGGEESAELAAAVQRAQAANIVIVAAAGNTPNDSTILYPAAYPGVVATVGVDRSGRHAASSVSGDEAVLAAPGVDIASTDLRTSGHTGWGKTTGTSPATAIVAGAVALVRAKYPALPAAEIIHRLTATADDEGAPGRDPDYGYGVVDVVKALTAAVPTLPPSSTPLTPQPAMPQPVTRIGAPPPAGPPGSGWPLAATIGMVIGACLVGGGVIITARSRRDR